MTPEVRDRIEQIRHGNVPEGYKTTRKGIIPNEWTVQQIRDFAVISSGSTPNRGNPAYWNGDIPWVTTGELEGGYITKTDESITMQALSETSLRVYPVGTLLMAMYGQGKTRGTVAKLGIEATVNQACAAISLKEGNPEFIFHALQNAYDDIRKLSNTGNQENLNADIIKTFSVMFPPIAEQTKIAEILTAQDKVIELKEKRFAEKQRQKKYLMQQLLTGKKRLPGFDGEWLSVAIGRFIHELDERTTCNNQHEILSVTKNGIVRQYNHFNKQIASEDNTGYQILRRNNLAFSTMNLWMGSVDVLENYEIGIISPAYKVFSFDSKMMDTWFGKQFMRSEFMIWLYKSNSKQGASVVRRNLDLKALLSTKVKIPALKEQLAIATVLRAADIEIDLLRQDIEQEKQKKKALMQLLLTGIVRALS